MEGLYLSLKTLTWTQREHTFLFRKTLTGQQEELGVLRSDVRATQRKKTSKILTTMFPYREQRNGDKQW